MPDASDIVQFSLAPKEKASGMEGELKLWFSTVDYTLQEILVDSPNAKTKLTFSALTLNPTFDETEFVFTAPKALMYKIHVNNLRRRPCAELVHKKSTLLVWDVPRIALTQR